jgi:PAS domain S-box-containing protein
VTGAQGLRAYVGHPVHDPGGHRIGTLCVADRRPRAWTEEDLATLHDLAAWVDLEIGWATLREAAEREQATETRLRAIIDSAAEGIVTLDAEGRVLLANPAATDMLGHRAEDLAGRVLHDVAHHSRPDGSPYPRAECPSHQTLAHGEFHRFLEEVYWRSDGTPLPVELSSTPLLDGDRLTGAVVVFRDATERHELERMKTDFISAVSHELRTPLTSISGYLEGVLAEDDGPLNDVQREDLEIVQRNAALLEALVDDLLLLSRMQAGRLEFARAAVPLDELLAELVEDLAPVASARDLRFDVSLLPVRASGDVQRLRQCFTNLLSNALKFGRAGTAVRVSAGRKSGEAVVEVTDSGPGIPADEVERLGQRFFRASTARGVEGTGLGLTITREIVDRHAGALDVESRLGEGSTFRVRLPVWEDHGA